MNATRLSRALVAPAVATVDGSVRQRIGHRLVAGVAGAVERLPPGEELEITLPVLRRALAHPELLLGRAEPFAWQPKFARRSLGLAVVQACAAGRFHSPTEAVGPIAAEAVDEWALTGRKTFYWEPWFAGLSAPGRALVLAEAVSWSTALWAAFDWSVLAGRLHRGAPTDQWALPVSRPVRLKCRSELRLTTAPSAADLGSSVDPPSLVSVSSGGPSPTCDEELDFLALPALRAGSLPLPARVVGLWPEAGVHRIVELDEAALERAADRLLEGVATLVGARTAGVASR